MLIETKKGNYKLNSNYRDAFVLEAFEEKYIEECFDRYTYIVGDISSGILRLKGFDTNPKSKNYFGYIENYLETSCAMGCPYYVLKRIKNEEEFQKEISNKEEVKTAGFVIHPIVKESYDKETLELESSQRMEPRIVIDQSKINSIPKGELAADLKEILLQDSSNKSSNNKQAKAENSTTYVSSSPDFVPNPNKNGHRNRNNQNKNNSNNKKKK